MKTENKKQTNSINALYLKYSALENVRKQGADYSTPKDILLFPAQGLSGVSGVADNNGIFAVNAFRSEHYLLDCKI